nr:MAG TPA: hypothetical protein [Caudoviricetes sp.]
MKNLLNCWELLYNKTISSNPNKGLFNDYRKTVYTESSRVPAKRRGNSRILRKQYMI